MPPIIRCPLLPVGDIVVVVPDAPPLARGRIVLSQAHAGAVTRGRVAAVGPEADNSAPVGSAVAWRPFAGTTVEIGEGSWLLLREEDVVARFDTV